MGRRRAKPLIQALQRCEAERSELQLWERVLRRAGLARAGAVCSAGAGPWLRARLFVLPPGAAPEQALPAADGGLETVAGSLEIDGATHLLVVGRPEALQSLTQAVTTLKGSAHDGAGAGCTPTPQATRPM